MSDITDRPKRGTYVERNVVGRDVVRKHVEDGTAVQPHSTDHSTDCQRKYLYTYGFSCGLTYSDPSTRSWSALPYDTPSRPYESPLTHCLSARHSSTEYVPRSQQMADQGQGLSPSVPRTVFWISDDSRMQRRPLRLKKVSLYVLLHWMPLTSIVEEPSGERFSDGNDIGMSYPPPLVQNAKRRFFGEFEAYQEILISIPSKPCCLD